MIRALKILTGLILLALTSSGQGIVERYVKGIENVETNLHFIYQGTYIPVLDITYHEFSADSVTWRKEYEDGDCYIRFNNFTDNSTNPYNGLTGYHPDSTWWVFNFCTCNGAIPDAFPETTVDTLFIVYNNYDTIVTRDTIILDGGLKSVDITIPAPDTVTGTSTNFQDSLTHTHELFIYINDNEDVDAYPTDGQVLKWNAITSQWEAANDLVGAGGAGELTVTEEDDSPNVTNVTEIRVTNGHLTNNGLGSVSLDLTFDPTGGVNDYWRAGKVRVPAGDNTITFDTPFDSTDYIVVSVYALLDYQDHRQNLKYTNETVNGFDVLDVVDSAYVHYLAIRNVDSLLTMMEDIGHVLASPSDTVLGYLNATVDDSTITVINEELHVLAGGLRHDSLLNLDWSVAAHVMDTTLEMNSHPIDSARWLRLDTSYVPTGTEPIGTVFWDGDNMTYSDVLTGGSVGQRYQELHIVVKNQTGSTINNLTPVMYDGVLGSSGRILADLAIADNSVPARYILGITTQDIANGEDGFVTPFGKVRHANTTGSLFGETWADGDEIFVSATTAGYLTNVQPQAPNRCISVGYVIDAAVNGTIEVRLRYNTRVQDAPDVNGTPLDTSGQILVWNNDSSYFDPNYNINDYKLNTLTSVRTVNAAVDTVLSTDVILNVTYTATDTVSVVLPTSEVIAGRNIEIKDGGGNATTNIIIITTEGAETIDGLATEYVDMNYGIIKLFSDGVNWFKR